MMTTTQQAQQGIEVPAGALLSDGMSRFVGMGAWAAMVSGVALVVSMVLAWLVVPYEQLGQTEAYLTSAYSVSSGLRLLGFVLLGWGLVGIYGPQARAAGTFGRWCSYTRRLRSWPRICCQGRASGREPPRIWRAAWPCRTRCFSSG